ncbi:MAG TPA: oxidoreductase [Mycobacteriales bacterium]|nr:oxidoreductase [Mycobacteriales bacterium]
MRTADPLLPLLDLPRVDESVANVRTDIDELRRHRVLRQHSAAVSAEAALHGARASAALEGADHPLESVRSGGVTDPVVQGALRVSTALGSSIATWERAPLQVLARLHSLAAAGLLPPDRLGRPAGSADRLAALARLVASDSDVPAVILAAVVHGELLALDAFPAANGILARAAARLVLITRGLDPKALSVPEVGHAAAVEEYRGAAAAYANGTTEGVQRWLLHCCAATRLGAQEGLAICEAARRR